MVPLPLDLRSRESINAAFADARARLGDIDLLVNNAGRALVKPSVSVTEAEWDDVMSINLKGAFFLSQLFGRACINDKRPGCIVSMASTHGMIGIAERAVYGISKAGLIQMTRMLAVEWADKGIRVNAVAPATVMTPSRQEMLKDPAVRRRHAGAHPDRPLRHAGGGRRRGGLSRQRRRGGGDRPHAAGRWRRDGDLIGALTRYLSREHVQFSGRIGDLDRGRRPAAPIGAWIARSSTPSRSSTYSSSAPRNDAARTSPISAP